MPDRLNLRFFDTGGTQIFENTAPICLHAIKEVAHRCLRHTCMDQHIFTAHAFWIPCGSFDKV
ncbi:uncharacterized protein METZ01_LOCUS479977 [marine metagenome]|uniref:Uncharacterized protein n=1 Tax=marine metagenome TaxID=408172 RepID=A0A383C4Y3_9ZZZZ